MAAIREDQYNQVVQWIQQQLLSKVEYHNEIQVVRPIDIDLLPSYEQYKESVGKVKKSKPQGIPPEIEEGFIKFWSEYPGISRFEYMGKKFEGERVLKANKQVCLKLYNDAISSIMDNWKHIKLSELGAAQTLINALQVQLEGIRQESYKSGQNRMQYMKSCEVYLRQKAYEPWIGQEMPKPLVDKRIAVDYTFNG